MLWFSVKKFTTVLLAGLLLLPQMPVRSAARSVTAPEETISEGIQETAVEAKNQLNRAIFWRQTRVFLKKAAPIAIPVVCVLAVGIPALVIYCRKKRRIRIQEEQGESDLA